MERDRLLAEAALARANALAVRETTRQMDEFMGIASHELKTPLTSTKGNLQLVERRLASMLQLAGTKEVERNKLSELQLLLGRAERQVDVLNRLVSDLVDLSRIQIGKLELRMAQVDLASIVQEVVED